MTGDGNKEDAKWPMPQFRFEVDLGTELKGIYFQEVSGMDVENQIIEYRKSNSKLFSTAKMPGIVKFGNITMKRGVFMNDDTFWNWYKQIKMNTIKRRTMLIKLIDENGEVAMQWQLDNAWPTKITTTNRNSNGNEIGVDTLEIAHEKLTISNGEL